MRRLPVEGYLLPELKTQFPEDPSLKITALEYATTTFEQLSTYAPIQIAQLKHAKISISNYSGVARTYVRKLISLVGASFTPDLSPENTHLVCAKAAGLKYEKAKEWGTVHVVNHTWLEDIFSRGCYLTEGIQLIGREGSVN